MFYSFSSKLQFLLVLAFDLAENRILMISNRHYNDLNKLSVYCMKNNDNVLNHRNCAKIKPRQKTENGWEYGNTY